MVMIWYILADRYLNRYYWCISIVSCIIIKVFFLFYSFPKDPVLKRKWKTFCNNKPTWVPTKNSVICSEHFKSSDFQALSNNRRKLIIGAVPTLKPSCLCSTMVKINILAVKIYSELFYIF